MVGTAADYSCHTRWTFFTLFSLQNACGATNRHTKKLISHLFHASYFIYNVTICVTYFHIETYLKIIGPTNKPYDDSITTFKYARSITCVFVFTAHWVFACIDADGDLMKMNGKTNIENDKMRQLEWEHRLHASFWVHARYSLQCEFVLTRDLTE